MTLDELLARARGGETGLLESKRNTVERGERISPICAMLDHRAMTTLGF